MKHSRLSFVVGVTALLAAAFMPVTARAEQTYQELINASGATLEQYFGSKEWEGVKNMVGAAKAIIVVPDLESGSFIVGYEQGSGVLLVRHGDKWSDPAFVSLSNESIGFQAGAKQSQLLMLVFTRSAVAGLVEGTSRVGGSGGFALGNFGVGGGGGGMSGGFELLTVSLSQGLSVGTGVAGMQIAPIDGLNEAAYGQGFDLATMLSKPGSLAAASKERAILTEAVDASWRK